MYVGRSKLNERLRICVRSTDFRSPSTEMHTESSVAFSSPEPLGFQIHRGQKKRRALETWTAVNALIHEKSLRRRWGEVHFSSLIGLHTPESIPIHLRYTQNNKQNSARTPGTHASLSTSVSTKQLGLRYLIRAVTKISSCRVNTRSRREIKQLGISFGSIFLLFSYESSRGPHS